MLWHADTEPKRQMSLGSVFVSPIGYASDANLTDQPG